NLKRGNDYLSKSLPWRELSSGSKIYLLSVYAAAIPATYLCLFVFPGSFSSYWILLTLASLFVSSINIRLPKTDNIVISMGDVFTILALIHFGSGPALVTYCIDATMATVTDRVRLYGAHFYRRILVHRLLFNLASCALAVLAMSL